MLFTDTPADPKDLLPGGETLTEILASVAFSPFVLIAMVGVSAMVLIMASNSFLKGEFGEGWALAGVGLFVGASPILLGFVVGAVKTAGREGVVADPGATPTVEPVPPPEPATPTVAAEPLDFSGVLMSLSVLGIAILSVVLIALVIWMIRKSLASAKATRLRTTEEKTAQAKLRAAWQHFHDQHDELLRKYLHAETDWDSLFYTPALTDPSVPQTAAMLQAMRDAGTARITNGELPATALPDSDLLAYPYAHAVANFAKAWDIAASFAKRVGQKGVPLAERKTIREIRTLLNIAENSGASSTERELAYKAARRLMEKLTSVHIPEKALLQLEERSFLKLEAGSSARAVPERAPLVMSA